VALASSSGEAFILHKHSLAFLLLDLVFALCFLLFCSSTPHLPVFSSIHRAHCVFWLGSWIRNFDSRSTILHLDIQGTRLSISFAATLRLHRHQKRFHRHPRIGAWFARAVAYRDKTGFPPSPASAVGGLEPCVVLANGERSYGVGAWTPRAVSGDSQPTPHCRLDAAVVLLLL
jgi:hypothetical protein